MTSNMVTWQELILEELEEHGEKWADVVSCTLTEQELGIKFDCYYGGPQGLPFTMWTKKRVYFPTEYDGAEGVASVTRDPDGKPTHHI